MSKQLETFVRNNRQALDTASPHPDTWDEISVHAKKNGKPALLKLLQKIKAWLGR